MTDSNRNSAFFAILIGIDTYASKPLKGCVNDINEIHRYFNTLNPPVQTQVLTGPKLGAKNLGSSNCDPCQQRPTHRAVESAFRNATTSATQGDFVYVHFAGHGTRAQTSDQFVNHNTGDLALVLLDDQVEDQEQYLRGAELASWLKEMVDKGLVVTLVLDCCFAASVYRYDESDTRYLGPTIRNLGRSRADAGTELLLGHAGPTRDSSMLPNWLINPDRYVVLAASGPDQEAKELQTKDGQYHGILSFLLLMIWQRTGGTRMKHRIVYHHLCAESRKHGFVQHPVLYGDKDQGFFGSPIFGIDTVPVVISKTRDRKLVMQAGEAHGVEIGDEFAVGRIDTWSGKLPDAAAAFIVATVSQVRGLTSELEVPDISLVPDSGVLAAKVCSRTAFRQTQILIAENSPLRNELIKTLQARSFGSAEPLQDSGADFHVSVGAHGHHELFQKSRDCVIDLDDKLSGIVDVATICNTIEHLRKFEILRRLSHQFTTDTTKEHTAVHIAHGDCRFSSNEALKVNNGAICELEVKNSTQQDLFVFVYSLGSDWQVENLLRGTYESIPVPDPQRGLTGLFRKKMRMTVPSARIAKGFRECEDVIKVIITFRPTSFDLFELPKLGKSRNSINNFMRNSQGSGSWTSEEWMAFTFTIRTVCAD